MGAGKIGRGIATGLSGRQDRVLLCDKDYAATQGFVEDLQTVHPLYEVEALECTYDACWEADIIILTMPCEEQQEMAQKIKAVANQKIVVTTSNSVKELQLYLPNSRIVQAFSSVDAAYFDENYCCRKAVDCFIAGDNEEAVKIVADLVKTIGFKPVISLSQPGFQAA